jgi:hypothetical protein
MEAIAKARFALFGTADYPDATFSPRLSFGTVRGWTEGNRTVAPFTTIGGMFERATGREPFELPGSWLKARSRLDPATPLNFTTDNDIVGGNSGSPLLNRDARLVGVVFDGNIHSLAGDYWFDERVNRTVALTGAAILEALEKVYGARRLAAELRGASKR